VHILLIHQAFVSPQQAGGTRHYELSRYLAQAGHKVTILGSQVNYLTGITRLGRRKLVEREQTTEEISIWRCYTYSALHRSFPRRLFAFLSFMVSSFLAGLKVPNVDLIWGTSPPIFQGLTALVLARVKRTPFLFEVRDLWPDFAIDLGVLRQPLLIKLSRGLEKLLYRKADRIIVNSPGFLQHLRNCGVEEARMATVVNSVDATQFDPSGRGEALRREWGLEEKCIALYAGAHGLANDLETLLEAAAILKGESAIHFVLVGDGKEKSNLMRWAESRGLGNVLFLPAQPKARMPQILAASDICIAILKNIPRFTTTFPNKVFDYMAAGRPTVLAIDGVIRQVIESADGGTFSPPGDPQSLADAVLALSRDPALRKRQGQNARGYALAHFERERQAQDLERIIGRMRSRRTYRGKRLLDLLLSLTAMIILLPILVLVAFLVRITLGPPVLFRQQRPGWRGRPFSLLKFRTMTNSSDLGGIPLPDAERLPAFGRFLRSTSLDELPELINVLRGEMSLVGPRPLLMQYLDRYTREQMRRHEVRPGITGWAQVNGRNALTWQQKFALDVWYVDHQSLWLDLKIMALTAWRILKREGINQPGQATAQEFMGNGG
jgi:lipopolysaccharide/colanic/teichoic acid biosynthesis glycosyltransferase